MSYILLKVSLVQIAYIFSFLQLHYNFFESTIVVKYNLLLNFTLYLAQSSIE